MQTPRHTGYPPIYCFEDKEHTARCVMAIRERIKREDEAVIVSIRKDH